MKQRLLEIVLILTAFFLPGFIWQGQALAPESSGLAVYMLQFLLLALPQSMLIIYILWLQKNPPLADFGLVPLRFLDLLHSLIIFLGVLGILLLLSLIIALLPTEGQKMFQAGFRWQLSDPKLIPLVLVFSIATAYREELFFRSYLITRFSQMGSGPMLNLLLSSLLFGLGHIYQGLAGFSVSFIQGLFFGMIFLSTKNIHRIALAHALYNTTVLLATLFSGYSLPDRLFLIIM
ncbi:hypothetical protein ES703_55023 [subsurface metagenome]